MQTQSHAYNEERTYAITRLIILFILFLSSFAISAEMIPQILLARLVLGGLILLSMGYSAFIASRSDTLVLVRKNVLIFLDLFTLTLFIFIFEKYGLYLFPFYVLIVMQSSLYFGKRYAYTSAASAVLSWVLLALYSPYWNIHYDIIISFALTTLLVALFSLRFMEDVEESEDKATVPTAKTNVDHTFLANLANRAMYKELSQEIIRNKETFNLIFISLDSFQGVVDKYGPHMGEALMEEAAKRLNQSIKEYDFLARLGENEFVIISKKQRTFLRNFLKKLEKDAIGACHIDGINTRIELSIGISLFPENGQNEMMLSKCADDALRAAKENPNMNYMFYGSIQNQNL